MGNRLYLQMKANTIFLEVIENKYVITPVRKPTDMKNLTPMKLGEGSEMVWGCMNSSA